MYTLSTKDEKLYNEILLNVIPNLSPGIHYPHEFFLGDQPTVDRVVKKLYKETVAGNIPRLSLVGEKSAEGYRKV